MKLLPNRLQPAFLILILFLATPMANATLLELSATSLPVNPNITASDFTVTFNDTGDGILQIEEVVSFSGVLFTHNIISGLYQEGDGLLGVADIAGISSSGLPSADQLWIFRNAGGTFFPDPIGDPFGSATRYWDYSVSAVPGPATLGLLIVGIAGIGFTRFSTRS